MLLFVGEVATDGYFRMLVVRFTSIRQKLLRKNGHSWSIFPWKGQIQHPEFLKQQDDLACYLQNCYHPTQVILFGQQCAGIKLLRRLLSVLDSVDGPGKPPIDEEEVAVTDDSILLHVVFPHPCQMAKKNESFLATDGRQLSALLDDADRIASIAENCKQVLIESDHTPAHLQYSIQITIHPMSFDFFEQQDLPQSNNNNDLFDIMKKMDFQDDNNLEFAFENFQDPNPHDPLDRSQDSDFLKQKSEKRQSEKMQSAKSRDPSRQQDFDNSRDLAQISIIDNSRSSSFHYQSAPPRTQPLDSANQRYLNLQRMINKAKTNNLDNFYRNLDQQNAYKPEDKFRNKEEFKQYRNNLKTFKKTLQEDYQAKNGNYRFQSSHYQSNPYQNNPTNTQYASAVTSKQQQQQQQQDPFSDYNFKKKTSGRPQSNNFFQNPPEDDDDFFNLNKLPANAKPAKTKATNFLPASEFQDDGLGDYELQPEDINREIQKYQQKQLQSQAINFFSENTRTPPAEKPKKKLQTINEQRANMFEVTQQEEKMTKLLSSYNQLKTNFNSLVQNFKQANIDKEKFISELRQVKTGIQNTNSRLRLQEENQKEKQLTRQHLKQEKNRKIGQIKQQIGRIKENSDKDVLILKLNEKVESLEDMLRRAIQDLNEQKDPKLIPKIINYYPEPQQDRLPSQRSDSRRSNRLNFDEEMQNQPEPIDRLEEDFLQPVRHAVRELRQDRDQVGEQLLMDLSSPLQLDLTVQQYPMNVSRGRSQQMQQLFVPAEGSREYNPTPLDSNNKYLRRSLTQKSSVLLQSFEFYVTGKFTVTGNDRFPVTCEVRVANKCAISLFDVFVIVYGPQAQEAELQMNPARIMHDEFKHSTSFLFEVNLGKSCLQSGHFSVQISYKSDPATKKKVNFKAVLPFVHLIKPEFIYQEQFINAWNQLDHQYYVRPRPLDFKNIRSHQDLKLILPFTEINEPDPNCFSYGIMFTFPRQNALMMLKVTCYVSGKASLHIKSQGHNSEKRFREQTLDILSFLIFG